MLRSGKSLSLVFPLIFFVIFLSFDAVRALWWRCGGAGIGLWGMWAGTQRPVGGRGCLRLVGRHVGLAAARAGGAPAAPERALGGCLVFPGFIFAWGALLSVVGKAEGDLCFGQVGLRML